MEKRKINNDKKILQCKPLLQQQSIYIDIQHIDTRLTHVHCTRLPRKNIHR